MHTTSITPPSSWRSSGWRETSFIREENKVSSTSLQTPRPAHPSTRPPQSWPTLVPGQLLWACVTPYRILPACSAHLGIRHTSQLKVDPAAPGFPQTPENPVVYLTLYLKTPMATGSSCKTRLPAGPQLTLSTTGSKGPDGFCNTRFPVPSHEHNHGNLPPLQPSLSSVCQL